MVGAGEGARVGRVAEQGGRIGSEAGDMTGAVAGGGVDILLLQ